MTRRRFLRALGQISSVAVGVGLYAWQWEPHWVEFVQRPLRVANLPNRLRGTRLVQMTDLHIGRQVDDGYLLKTFERVKELDPEIVAYTGDFISYEGDELAHLRRLFSFLPVGQLATVGILGNHDHGRGWSRLDVAQGIVKLAAARGIQILRNELVNVAGLQIVGLNDLWAQQFHPEQVLPGVDPARAALALVHNPDAADQPGWGQYAGWILCGHTHGGQCKPPFLPAPLLPVKNRRYRAGEYGLGQGRRMYIIRGVGHLLQVRMNVRPEVTIFQLETV
jgi:predicted MPP superfamily phosphohydrolase